MPTKCVRKAKSAKHSSAAKKGAGYSVLQKLNKKAAELKKSNRNLTHREAISKAAALYRSKKL